MSRDVPLDLAKGPEGNVEIPRCAMGRDPVPMVGGENELGERSPVASDCLRVLTDDEVLLLGVLAIPSLGVPHVEGRSESLVCLLIDQTEIEHAEHESLLARRVLTRQHAEVGIVLR